MAIGSTGFLVRLPVSSSSLLLSSRSSTLPSSCHALDAMTPEGKTETKAPASAGSPLVASIDSSTAMVEDKTETKAPASAGSPLVARIDSSTAMVEDKTETKAPASAGSPLVARIDSSTGMHEDMTETKAPEPKQPRLDMSPSTKRRRPDTEPASVMIAVPEPSPPKVAAEERLDIVWKFICKLCIIFSIQSFVSTAIAGAFLKVDAITSFFDMDTVISWAVYLLIVFSTPLGGALYLMLRYKKISPYNLLLLGQFTLSASFSACLILAPKGVVAFLCLVLTTASAISLVMFSVWAHMKAYKLNFLSPFLMAASTSCTLYCILQIWSPLGRFRMTVPSLIFSLLITAVLIYLVKKIIHTNTVKDVGFAAISLYVQLGKRIGSQLSLSLV